MSTTAKRRAHGDWQTGFLSLLPAIKRHAERALRGRDPETIDEAMSEILAHATCAYHGLYCRGKQRLAFASVLARFAVAGYRAGRRTGTAANSCDVYSSEASRRAGVRRVSIDRASHTANSDLRLSDLLVDSRNTPVLDQVAFRIDFPAWLATLKPRDQQITGKLAMAYTTLEVSREFNLSPGRISQLRRELAESWSEFVGDTDLLVTE